MPRIRARVTGAPRSRRSLVISQLARRAWCDWEGQVALADCPRLSLQAVGEGWTHREWGSAMSPNSRDWVSYLMKTVAVAIHCTSAGAPSLSPPASPPLLLTRPASQSRTCCPSAAVDRRPKLQDEGYRSSFGAWRLVIMAGYRG